MTRQEFLKTLWTKFFRPGLIAIVLFIAIRLLYRTIAIDGTERQTIFILTGIVILMASLLLISLVVGFFSVWLVSKLPKRVKSFLSRLNKTIGYLAPMAVGALLYYMWDQENYYAMIVPVIFILMDLRRIILGIGDKSGSETGENAI